MQFPSYKLNACTEPSHLQVVWSLLLPSSGMRFCSLLFPLGFLAIVNGVHLELRGKTGISRSNFQRRTSLSGLQTSLQDDQNIQYMTNITLNGKSFGVLIDTGRKVHAFQVVIFNR